MVVRAPITPDLLRWAREQAGFRPENVARRLKKQTAAVHAWENGSESPTLNQLRTLAGLTAGRSLFFLPSPPEGSETERPPDFRSSTHSTVSPALLREISKADERRRHHMDLAVRTDFLDERHELDIWSVPVRKSRLAETAATVRESLGISVARQISWNSENEALANWISALDMAGILVFHMSRIDPKECRGLSLYRDPWSLIILNGAEDQLARIFTLMHELGHLLLHASGICTVWTKDQTEAECNAFAAALLLPGAQFLMELGRKEAISSIPTLAQGFRVSQSAVAVRLKNLGLISDQALQQQLDIARRLWLQRRERQRLKSNKGGPPHHKIHLRNLGVSYVSNVLQAMDSEAISLVDAAHYLDAKLQTIERMRADLVSGGDIFTRELVS